MKFIHVSDTHLGCQIPVQYSDIRREDFLKAFSQVIDFAINKKVDFIIHSGDFFDDYFRFSSKYVIEILDLLLKLKEKDIPLFYIRGNHDIKGHKQQVLDLFSKLDLIKEVSLKKPGEFKDIKIYGISEPSTISGETLSIYYKSQLSNFFAEKSGYNIFLFHGAINIFPESIIESFRDPRVLSTEYLPKNIDYYGFGHFHKRYYDEKDGKKFVLPGSTERTEISKEEEKSEKGFYYIEDDKIEFIKINVRPIYIYEGILEKEEDIEKLKENIYKKSKETIIKLKIRYNKDLYYKLKSTINSLIEDKFLIIDDSLQIDDKEFIDNYISTETLEEIIDKNILISNKEEILNLFNIIKEYFDDFYTGRESELDRIREELFKVLIK